MHEIKSPMRPGRQPVPLPALVTDPKLLERLSAKLRNAKNFGSRFWFVKVRPQGRKEYFWADEVRVKHGGALVAYRREGSELVINLAFSSSEWTALARASATDGTALCITDCPP